MSIRQTFNYSRSNIISGGPEYPLLSPSVLFTSGQKGFWYEANDSTTLWQDSAQTIQIDSTSQNVNAWSDKSGNNFDLNIRTLTAGSTGLLYQVDGGGNDYIYFDRGMLEYDPGGTNSWSGSGVQEITVFVAIDSITDNAVRGCFATTPRSFSYVDLRIYAHYSTGPRSHYDNIGENVFTTHGSSIKNNKSVITAKWRYDQINPTTVFRINGTNVLSGATVSGTNTNSPTFYQREIQLGGPSSSYFWGNYYGAVGVVGTVDYATMVGVEKYMAELMGISSAGWS